MCNADCVLALIGAVLATVQLALAAVPNCGKIPYAVNITLNAISYVITVVALIIASQFRAKKAEAKSTPPAPQQYSG
jgi:hypothetical protein